MLTANGDDAEALVKVLAITAGVLGFDRASLVAHIEGSDHAFVIAATDAEPLQRFTLAIAEYPEIVEAIRTLQPVLIDDVLFHPLTAAIADMLSSRQRARRSRCSRCSGAGARSARSCCASATPGVQPRRAARRSSSAS